MSDTPPQDHQAEQSVLGALLNGGSRDLVDELAEVLTADDFYRPIHGKIFDACLAVSRDGERVDPVLVGNRLDMAELQRAVNGLPYLHTLMQAPVTMGNALYHARIVHEKATGRRLVEAGLRIQQLGNTHATPSEAVEDARAQLDALSQQSTRRDGGELVGNLLADALDAIENPDQGVPSPWPDIDRLTQGLHAGRLTIIGARPAVGKSVLAANLAEHAARNGRGTYFATLEMGRREVVNRLLSHRCRVDLSLLTKGELTETEWDRVAARSNELHDWPLMIDDDGSLSLQQLRARARSAARRMPLGLVVVDYLQLMRPRDERVSREQQVAELSRGLKALAKELDVPVVALAQLNRNAHDEPTMKDLRESGQIEADADQIWLLHRPDLYDADDCPGQLFVHVAKNRQGPPGRATLAFHGHYSAAESYAGV